MRPESRIPTERGRRVVIAGIMACVLAASTALAVWLSGARAPGTEGSFRGAGGGRLGPGTFTVHPFGWFQLKLPQSWAGLTLDDAPPLNQPGLIRVGHFLDPQEAAQQLSVYQLILPGAGAGPDVALRLAGEALGVPVHQPVWVQTPQMIAMIDEAMIQGPGGIAFHQVMAALTIDGRRHVLLRLITLGPRSAANRDLLAMIVESVRVARPDDQGRQPER